MKGYTVNTIKRKDAIPWIKLKHYARRVPSICHSFGLYFKNELRGIITYGIPASPNLCRGICGKDYSGLVLEFNRLCLENNIKNEASYFVSKTLKLLPAGRIIVSYADTGQNHIGYVYQATNWIYTGAVKAHDSEYKINGHSYHARTLTSSGITAPLQWAKDNNIEIVKPKEKHRYVYFVGSKKFKKEMLSKLNYPILPYPKGESKRYDASAEFAKQVQMFT